MPFPVHGTDRVAGEGEWRTRPLPMQKCYCRTPVIPVFGSNTLNHTLPTAAEWNPAQFKSETLVRCTLGHIRLPSCICLCFSSHLPAFSVTPELSNSIHLGEIQCQGAWASSQFWLDNAGPWPFLFTLPRAAHSLHQLLLLSCCLSAFRLVFIWTHSALSFIPLFHKAQSHFCLHCFHVCLKY